MNILTPAPAWLSHLSPGDWAACRIVSIVLVICFFLMLIAQCKGGDPDV